MNISNAVAGIILILVGMTGLFILINNISSSSNTNSSNEKILVGTAVHHQTECKPMEINILGVTIRKNDTEVCK